MPVREYGSTQPPPECYARRALGDLSLLRTIIVRTHRRHHRLESHYWRVQRLLHGEASSGEGEMETIRCWLG